MGQPLCCLEVSQYDRFRRNFPPHGNYARSIRHPATWPPSTVAIAHDLVPSEAYGGAVAADDGSVGGDLRGVWKDPKKAPRKVLVFSRFAPFLKLSLLAFSFDLESRFLRDEKLPYSMFRAVGFSQQPIRDIHCSAFSTLSPFLIQLHRSIGDA